VPSALSIFKDYISTPKQNDYRSLHTTIIGPKQQRVELQIRSFDMDRIAEFGIAAHPLYKDGLVSDRERLARESSAYAWLRQTVTHIAESDAPEEFLENTKLELFRDQVFCFTPKGRLIALPRGATPIDFAYAVHTDVGDTCVGAKVNGKLSPLIETLKNGDEVEIIRSDAQRPPPAWESIVVTGKARAAIRRATRVHVRNQYTGLGRHILERAFTRLGKAYSDGALIGVLARLGHSDCEDALAAVGRGEVDSAAVLKAVFPDYRDERAQKTNGKTEEGWLASARSSLKFNIPGRQQKKKRKKTKNGEASLPIRGVQADIPVRFAPDGGAVPGDRIIGILTPGEGITIYPIQSPALVEFDDESDRWVDVRWDIADDSTERFAARVKVSAINEPGTLAEIAEVIGSSDGNIDNVKMLERGLDFTVMEIELEVWDLKHLNRIVSQLRAKPVVSNVERVNG
jgi:(p)ppGpp synthase/HD superfamily hydrolase